ncbi:hypothetical protein [Salibacterium aidingense]|uniref:hypothetical protein n=1 Tax=Salibacterium aidingense TaxID=384933 RepID=UPI003BE3525F
MNVKLYCYRKGAEVLRKEIAKLERQKSKISDELLTMTDENSSVRQRANKRMRLAQIGEDIRHKEVQVGAINELIAEETKTSRPPTSN